MVRTKRSCKKKKKTRERESIKKKYNEFDLFRIQFVTISAGERKEKIGKILYIIGPEGGFEKEEVEYLAKQGAQVVSLGKRILRAETAAIVVGGILVHEFE